MGELVFLMLDRKEAVSLHRAAVAGDQNALQFFATHWPGYAFCPRGCPPALRASLAPYSSQ